MKKKLVLISVPIVVCIAVAIGVFFYLHSRTIFNDSYVNGNTTGNLYNAGLVCEYDNTIYFANPSDDYKLYAMDANGSNLQKLSDDTSSFINVDENYIYYIRNNPRIDSAFSFLQVYTDSLCRINRSGKGDIKILDLEPCLYASLIGNYVYYLHFDNDNGTTALYKVKIDGTEKQQVSPTPYFTCSTNGSFLSYNGINNDHYVRQLNTQNDTETIIARINAWMPTVVGSTTIYFMDCDNDYRLAKYDIMSDETTLLSEDRVDCYNLVGDYIYFQRNKENENALCRVRTDGTEFEVLMEGVYTDINVSDSYIYFRNFNFDIMYRAPLSDPTMIQSFAPGKVTES